MAREPSQPPDETSPPAEDEEQKAAQTAAPQSSDEAGGPPAASDGSSASSASELPPPSPSGDEAPDGDEVLPAEGEEAPSPAKLDPEALTLRAPPSPVVRVRRDVIIVAAAVLSIIFAAVTWTALQPTALDLVDGDQAVDLRGREPAEVVAEAPASYDEVPQLGPALPGDLGRPILAHRREMEAASEAESTADMAAQAAEAARLQAEAEENAARQSGILVQLADTAPPRSSATAESGIEQQSHASSASPVRETDPARAAERSQSEAGFFAGAGNASSVNPHRLAPPPSPYTLSAGSVIAASLITGLNSDLPGLVTAQVTQNVYDSATGRILLVPQGSRLLGTYDSVTAFGQERALVVWQRLILPGGSSIRIDNMPASDVEGYAGLADEVDLHTWQLLKGVVLSTILGVGSELSLGDSESDLVRALRESTQQNGARAGDRIVSRNLSIEPTVRVRPGWPLRIAVSKDLILKPFQRSAL